MDIPCATAHLAGALGLPVWTLLGYAPDWRWMLNRKDSPWYPTMRLFRQTKCDEWQGVVRRVKSELEKMVQKNCLTTFPSPNNSADVKWPNKEKKTDLI